MWRGLWSFYTSEGGLAADTDGLCPFSTLFNPPVMSEVTRPQPSPPPVREPSWMGGSPLAQLWPFPALVSHREHLWGLSGSQPLFLQRRLQGRKGEERSEESFGKLLLSYRSLTSLAWRWGGGAEEHNQHQRMLAADFFPPKQSKQHRAKASDKRQ